MTDTGTAFSDEHDADSAHRDNDEHSQSTQSQHGGYGTQEQPGGGSTAAERLGGPSEVEQAFAGDSGDTGGTGGPDTAADSAERRDTAGGDTVREDTVSEDTAGDVTQGTAEGTPVRETGDTAESGVSAGAEDVKPATDGKAGSDAKAAATGDAKVTLIDQDRAESYKARWVELKGDFVDEPRRAVRGANELVGEVLDELEELFRKQRADIEQGLDSHDATTEDLRLALGKYRSFFERLLSI